MMNIAKKPDRTAWSRLCVRPTEADYTARDRVRLILDAVRTRGDEAVREYTERFDGTAPSDWRVSLIERDRLAETVDRALASAIDQAIANLSAFHRGQQAAELSVETQPGVRCFRRAVAIERVGLYIPGGTAPLFSTLLMLAVPARLAGCKEIVLVTPPGKAFALHPAIAYAARALDVDEIYNAGGAQAIGALAYGTGTLRRVQKILGPGNRYVTEAKMQVMAEGVAIDLPAGPSEVLVIADDSADPEYVAADLLAQAEHGPDSQVMLVTTSEALLPRVSAAIEEQLCSLPRAGVARQSLEASRAVLVNTIEEAFEFSNLYAPEHLIVALADSEAHVSRIVNAGSVFLGAWSPESLGDYASGTNHVLPTNGAACAFSGVSLETFQKKITFQSITRDGLAALGPHVVTMARAEGLEGHAQAVLVRAPECGAEKDI